MELCFLVTHQQADIHHTWMSLLIPTGVGPNDWMTWLKRKTMIMLAFSICSWDLRLRREGLQKTKRKLRSAMLICQLLVGLAVLSDSCESIVLIGSRLHSEFLTFKYSINIKACFLTGKWKGILSIPPSRKLLPSNLPSNYNLKLMTFSWPWHESQISSQRIQNVP